MPGQRAVRRPAGGRTSWVEASTDLRAQERERERERKEEGRTAGETGDTRQWAGQGAGVAGAGLKIEVASDGLQESSMAQLTDRPFGMFASESG